MQLNNFNITDFMAEYWQKKPLLIKNAWPDWSNPIDPDELAGLACEEGVEARLVKQRRDRWEIEHGPVPEPRFGELGKKQWTLLVQAVDHYVPEVAALIEPFRFVPNWRIDDGMVSYAADQGGVGPHFDQYDVFLIQGLGQRRWQIGAYCDDATETLPHDDLRLLAHFEPREEWVLEPGDILYVPPRIAHNGVAVGDDCMTYSIGFRAPSRSELIAHYCDHLIAGMDDDDRYEDPDLTAQENPGEIGAAAIDRLHAMVTEKMSDRDAFARWFGEYSSSPKYPDEDGQPEGPVSIERLRQALADGRFLHRNPASRFSFVRQGTDAVLLFVDGAGFECSGETALLAERICAQASFAIESFMLRSDGAMELLTDLFNRGKFTFEHVE